LTEKLEKSRNTHGVYIDICIQEHLSEKLLALCRADPPDYLERLYPHLVPDYANELDPLFTSRIRNKAKQAGGRSAYQRVCDLIRHYIKACGKSGAGEIIKELLEAHRRQPAFVDELGRIKM
jgi:hypothetical protein